MNGSRGRANNFLLDGTDMNDGYRNDPAINEAGVFGDPATILPIDAVAELRVLSNYEAEYGRNSGAVVNIVTKSGTNSLHGSALEYNRTSSVGGARNFFNTAGAQDPFHNNQFGGSSGRTDRKNHTFFYVGLRRAARIGCASRRAACPIRDRLRTTSAAIGTGESGDYCICSRGIPIPHQIFSAEFITQSDISLFDSGCPTGTILLFRPGSNRVDSFIGKIDHNFQRQQHADRPLLFWRQRPKLSFRPVGRRRSAAGFNTATPTRVQLISLSYVKVINSSQLNEARLGWNRFVEGFFPEDEFRSFIHRTEYRCHFTV